MASAKVSVSRHAAPGDFKPFFIDSVYIQGGCPVQLGMMTTHPTSMHVAALLTAAK
jgi:hypothetical protein